MEELRRHLSLLKFLGFVRAHQAGKVPYWLRHGADGGPWIDYTALPDQPRFERARFKLKAQQLIEASAKLRSVYERGRT